MSRRFRFQQLSALALLLVFALASFSAAQKKAKKEKVIPEGTPVMWREPVDIATRDLYLGAGGEEMKPDLSKVTLIREEMGGYSKKYRYATALVECGWPRSVKRLSRRRPRCG